MDYTTIDLVKQAMLGTEGTEDDLLARLVAAASRAIDHHCANERATDYFKSETLTDEVITGQLTPQGVLHCWPHKSLVDSVSELSWRSRPGASWNTVDTDKLAINGNLVQGWLETRQPVGRIQVQISYTGGLAEDTADLPADLVEATTLLTVRYYKEAQSGLSDSIGVAELGTLMYTKAWPIRVLEMLKPYKRVTPW